MRSCWSMEARHRAFYSASKTSSYAKVSIALRTKRRTLEKPLLSLWILNLKYFKFEIITTKKNYTQLIAATAICTKYDWCLLAEGSSHGFNNPLKEEQVRTKAGAEAHWGADKMAQRAKVHASQAYQLNFSQRWVGGDLLKCVLRLTLSGKNQLPKVVLSPPYTWYVWTHTRCPWVLTKKCSRKTIEQSEKFWFSEHLPLYESLGMREYLSCMYFLTVTSLESQPMKEVHGLYLSQCINHWLTYTLAWRSQMKHT